MIAITFSGPMACGKTTAVGHATSMLKERGYTVYNLDNGGRRPAETTDNDVLIRTSYDTPELTFRIEAAGLPYAIIEAVCQRAVTYAKGEVSNHAMPPAKKRGSSWDRWMSAAVDALLLILLIIVIFRIAFGA